MNEIDSRLIRCFQAVFPHLPAAKIPSAQVDTVPGWDSVAMVNLLNLVAEEFEIEPDWERVEEFTSFSAIRGMIADRAATAGD